MLTPIELQAKVFKTGIGYDKKDVEAFIREVIKSYEHLYKENMELNEKLAVLSEGMQYYKNLEKTLQKTLVIAQKTAQDTENTAKNNAAMIEKEAKAKARELVYDAKQELDRIQVETTNLVQQYEKYKAQYKQLASTQLEYLSSGVFELSYSPINLKKEMEPIGLEVNAYEGTSKSQDEEIANKDEVTPTEVSPSEQESIMSILQHASTDEINVDTDMLQSSIVEQQVVNEQTEEQESQVTNEEQKVEPVPVLNQESHVEFQQSYEKDAQEESGQVYTSRPEDAYQQVYVERPEQEPEESYAPQESSPFNNSMNQSDSDIQDAILKNELSEEPIPVNQLVDELLEEEETPVVINVQNESIQSANTITQSNEESSNNDEHKKSKFSLFSNLLFKEEDKEDKPEVHLSHDEDYSTNYQNDVSYDDETTKEETAQKINVLNENVQEVNTNNTPETSNFEHSEESDDDDDFGFEFIDLDD